MPDPVGPAGVDATSFSQPALPTAVAGALGEARRELCEDILRGHGGRSALARFSDRFDGILRQLIAAAPKIQQPVTVVAIGGYGRRQLCLHSDIDLLLLFGGHLGDERRTRRARDSASAVGSRPRGRPPGPRDRGVRKTRGRQSGIPDGTRGCEARGRRPGAVRSVRNRLPSCRHPRARRRRAQRAHRRAVCAVQCDALSTGARRQGSARGTARSDGHALDCGAHRSVASTTRTRGYGANRRCGRLSAAGPIDPAPRKQTQSEPAAPLAARKGG